MTKASKKKAGKPRNVRPKEQGSGNTSDGTTDAAPKPESQETTQETAQETTPRRRTGPQCKARRTNGQPCKNAPIKGGTVCARHGGGAPQVREKANQRLLEMVMPALARIRKIILNPNTSDADALKAAREVLNRTGFTERFALDIAPDDKWAELLAGGLEDDRSLSNVPAAPELEAGQGQLDIYNMQQHGLDARDENWRDIRREDAEEYESGRIYPDENTIQGRVVGDSTWSPLDEHDASQASGPSQHDPRPQGPPSETGYAAYERRLAEAAEDEAERRRRGPKPILTRPREPRR